MHHMRRFVLPQQSGLQLPLHIESIGFHQDQDAIVRPGGYPYFHWIQTASGEGMISWNDRTETLRPNSGILLFPGVAHEYYPVTDGWETIYLTFGGSLSSQLLSVLEWHETTFFHWGPGTPLETLLLQILDSMESETDVFGLQLSTDVYRFLITLHKFGQLHKDGPVSSNLTKLRPLLDWMDVHYPNPSIGLIELADVLKMQPRRLNVLFRSTFGLTPYSYFLLLRLRKAKELLIGNPDLPVVRIAAQVGFRDASHFVATFRKHVGIPPEQFRRLN